jgi:hypothetical protein
MFFLFSRDPTSKNATERFNLELLCDHGKWKARDIDPLMARWRNQTPDARQTLLFVTYGWVYGTFTINLQRGVSYGLRTAAKHTYKTRVATGTCTVCNNVAYGSSVAARLEQYYSSPD